MLTDDQKKLLGDLQEFIDGQPDTGPYQEDEFKAIWAIRCIEQFTAERS